MSMPMTMLARMPTRHTKAGKNIRRGGERILVAALGNELLMDDGVGIHLARELAKTRRRNVQVVEVGTAVLDALHLFEWADRVLALDAVQAGNPPGTVYYFDIGKASRPEKQLSMHEFSLIGTLGFIPPEMKPKQILVLGVEPAQIECGLELSRDVRANLHRATQAANMVIAEWQAGRDFSDAG